MKDEDAALADDSCTSSFDAAFMALALEEARKAEQLGEVPVGALMVRGDVIVGRGHNRREIDADPLAHAELLAIATASKHLEKWRLSDCTLYVTLEPCTMCAGAIVNARIGRLVFGATDPKAGAVCSLAEVCTDPRLNHIVDVKSGVMAEACGNVLKEFFRTLRDKKKSAAKAGRTADNPGEGAS